MSENNIILPTKTFPARLEAQNQNWEARLTSPGLNLAIFLVPVLMCLQFSLVGSIYGGDLLLVGLFFGLLWRGRSFSSLKAPLPKRFLTLGFIWLFGQVVTDIVRHTSTDDSARGWARIVLTLLHFSVLFILLHGRPRQVVIYGWGLVVGSVLTYFLHPFVFAAQYPWEFGWGFPVTLAVFLLTSGRTYRSLLLPLGLAALNIYLGFRSMGAVCFLVSIYLFLRIAWLKSETPRQVPLRAKQAVAALILVAFGAWGMASVYEKAASSGLLGDEAKYKYEFQSSGEYGLLLAGRSEILLGLLAIYDSPVLGHGSWAKDPDYVAAYQQAMLLLGYDQSSFQRGQGTGIDSDENDYLIVAHSHILGAWVEAGILGAFFFLWLLVLAFRFLKHLFTARIRLGPLVTFSAFWLIWNLCFEPYGGNKRFSVLYFAVVLISYMSLLSARSTSPFTSAAELSTAK